MVTYVETYFIAFLKILMNLENANIATSTKFEIGTYIHKF